MRKEVPWTLEEKSIKESKKKSAKKKSKDKVKFFEDDVVAAARIINLFEKNKNKIYTNKEITEELGLSSTTVTKVTTRLESVSKIKIVGILQPSSAYTLYYQHINGPDQRVKKRRGIDGNKKDTAQLMLELFEENKNKVFTKKELIEILTNKGESEGQINTSLKILLLNWDIKIVGDEGNVLQYQFIKGNQVGLKVYGQSNKKYIKLSEYLSKNNVVDKKEFFLKALKNKTPRLFYSSKSIQKQYLITDLDRILKNSKSFIRRIFSK